MFRFASFALLGLVLSFPVAASATDADRQPIEVAAVSSGDAAAGEVTAKPSREAERSESARRSSDGGVRGLRQGDPGVVRFNNPYAFPLQTLPIALPSFAGMGL